MNSFLQRYFIICLILTLSIGLSTSGAAQQVTGVWKGKINGDKVELKLIQNGDSLTGVAYYYSTAKKYRRYSIKGYFDTHTNEVVWWDDQLIEEKKVGLGNAGQVANSSRADFSCPDGRIMLLEGSSNPKTDEEKPGGSVSLKKTETSTFEDEWDYVIENYGVAFDPTLIDSIELIALKPIDPLPQPVVEKEIVAAPVTQKEPEPVAPVLPTPPVSNIEPVVNNPSTIEEKFTTRKKIFTLEMPVAGDSIELRFYDNAEIDGDSISLFLNGALLFEHIRLSEKAYIFKIPVANLNADNELVMVAENLGTIPPNTSYMVAIIDGKRYETKLASTQYTSAMVRLKRAVK